MQHISNFAFFLSFQHKANTIPIFDNITRKLRDDPQQSKHLRRHTPPTAHSPERPFNLPSSIEDETRDSPTFQDRRARKDVQVQG